MKGPDGFGHDGDAQGKKRSIEDIDKVFFGTLRKRLKTERQIIVISSDHSTPCIRKAHSGYPVPVLFSGKMVKKDASARFAEKYASTGSIGRIMGSTVLRTAIDMIRNNTSAMAC
jgi:2,3-bisphosphoglycerate-independent phosphoglycerate mutase